MTCSRPTWQGEGEIHDTGPTMQKQFARFIIRNPIGEVKLISHLSDECGPGTSDEVLRVLDCSPVEREAQMWPHPVKLAFVATDVIIPTSRLRRARPKTQFSQQVGRATENLICRITRNQGKTPGSHMVPTHRHRLVGMRGVDRWITLLRKATA